jgi:hypothetical protein
MRMPKLTSTLHIWTCCLLLLGGPLVSGQPAGRPSSSCENELPSGIEKAVLAKLKGWKIVTLGELSQDDQEIFADSYEEKCPGIATGQFAPGQSPAYAITLVRSRSGALYQTLVLAAEKNRRYQVTTLSPQQRVAAPSIVRKLPAGSYSSQRGEIQIAAAYDVIAYERIQAGTVIYFWSNNKYRSLVISE